MKMTIITITYNAEKVISKTIESVLHQTKPVYEYVFVDGGSSDLTNEIIDSYKEAFESIGVKIKHVSEKDNGISDAFNKGIRLATGELIGIINADDELLPSTNEFLDQHFILNKDVDVIYGNCIWLDEEHDYMQTRMPRHDLERLKYDLVLIHPATFVTKLAYQKYGVFNIDYKLCMDKELLARMYFGGAKFSYIDNEIALMRAGGVSDKNAWRTIKEGIKLSNHYKCPKVITYSKALKKIVKHKVSIILKNTHFYNRLKQRKRNITKRE